MAQERRRDKARAVLKTGEGQRKNGTYYYRWQDRKGNRHYVYAKSLAELREKEKEVQKDKFDGIKVEARFVTVNDLYELWKQMKRGLKNNTFENYTYMYEMYVQNDIGKRRITDLKKSDVKRFYNRLHDDRGLRPGTIDSVHTVLHQVLDMAVDDDYIRNNPSDRVLKELMQAHAHETEKRRALTAQEQELLLSFLKGNETYGHWYPLFAVMVGTGMQIGETTGLRWCDIDLDEGIIDVNHTLVYYNHRNGDYRKGNYFGINSPKTKAGRRQVPMLDFVKEAFLLEKTNQEASGIKCNSTVDDYTDFIFLNRFGEAQHQGMINKAILRIIRDCNDAQFDKSEHPDVLLPHFSCHTLRHTFTTRMVEAGVNVKVIQDTLGHQDITTTMNIYVDVTKELKQSEFAGLDQYFQRGSRISVDENEDD